MQQHEVNTLLFICSTILALAFVLIIALATALFAGSAWSAYRTYTRQQQCINRLHDRVEDIRNHLDAVGDRLARHIIDIELRPEHVLFQRRHFFPMPPPPPHYEPEVFAYHGDDGGDRFDPMDTSKLGQGACASQIKEDGPCQDSRHDVGIAQQMVDQNWNRYGYDGQDERHASAANQEARRQTHRQNLNEHPLSRQYRTSPLRLRAYSIGRDSTLCGSPPRPPPSARPCHPDDDRYPGRPHGHVEHFHLADDDDPDPLGPHPDWSETHTQSQTQMRTQTQTQTGLSHLASSGTSPPRCAGESHTQSYNPGNSQRGEQRNDGRGTSDSTSRNDFTDRTTHTHTVQVPTTAQTTVYREPQQNSHLSMGESEIAQRLGTPPQWPPSLPLSSPHTAHSETPMTGSLEARLRRRGAFSVHQEDGGGGEDGRLMFSTPPHGQREGRGGEQRVRRNEESEDGGFGRGQDDEFLRVWTGGARAQARGRGK